MSGGKFTGKSQGSGSFPDGFWAGHSRNHHNKQLKTGVNVNKVQISVHKSFIPFISIIKVPNDISPRPFSHAEPIPQVRKPIQRVQVRPFPIFVPWLCYHMRLVDPTSWMQRDDRSI
jgi:hypothetical protein